MPALGTRKPLTERFWKKVARAGPDECWLWTGAINVRTRYGIIQGDAVRRNQLLAHRVSWEIAYGAIPKKPRHHVHHECENRACVNPAHLTLLSVWEHALEHGTNATSRNVGKTRCVNGHDFTPENTYRYRNASGNMRRMCRTCVLESGKRRRAEHRG